MKQAKEKEVYEKYIRTIEMLKVVIIEKEDLIKQK